MANELALPDAQGTSPATLYLLRLGEGSRRAQAGALRTLVGLLAPTLDLRPDEFPWHKILPEHASLLHARVQKDYAPATARRILSALRGTIKEAWRAGLLNADARDRICDLPPVRVQTRTGVGRMLTESERKALWEAAEGDERVLLALCLWGGLRRSEAAHLKSRNVAASKDEALLTVLGKGRRSRLVTLHGEPARVLYPYRDGSACTHPDLPVLPWTAGGIPKVLARLARQAQIAPFTCHDLRRTYCSMALERSDLATVQAAMGHADPRTTAQYDRRGEDAQRRLAERMSQ